MLVRVKPARTMGFIVPVPFFVLDIFLEAIGDLFILGQLVWPFGIAQIQKHIKQKRWGNGVDITIAWDIVEEFFFELRKYGRWRMVEVKTRDVEVNVDLY